ncbi:MAG TPA: DUF1080 domain-containing protein [Tepidisphaeraceae bacterium]
MTRRICLKAAMGWALAGMLMGAQDAPKTDAPKPDAEGFVSLFDGKTLNGWDGMPGYWSVVDGAIVGKEEKEKSEQTFLIYKGKNFANFELHFKYKFGTPDGNSGIQLRSKVITPATWRVGGYQADMDGKTGYDGSIYDEAKVAGRQVTLSNRGEKTVWTAEGKREVDKLPESNAELKKFIHTGGWNEAVVVCDGPHITYSINGHLMTDMTDNSSMALKEGVLALQLHKGFTMEIEFKDLKIKELK